MAMDHFDEVIVPLFMNSVQEAPESPSCVKFSGSPLTKVMKTPVPCVGKFQYIKM